MSADTNQKLASLLYDRSQELLDGQHWIWPEEVEEAAIRLLDDPVVDGTTCWPAQRVLSIGYALRAAELEVIGGTTFDDDYSAKLAQRSRDDPCMAVSAGALAVRNDLPAAFRAPAEVWERLIAKATEETRCWAEQMKLPDVQAALSDQVLGRAFALGYGLAYSYTAINSAASRPPDDATSGADDDVPAWGLAGGQANAYARELIDDWNLARTNEGDAFPPCLLLAYDGHNEVDVLRMDFVSRHALLELLIEKIVEYQPDAAALLVPEYDPKVRELIPCAFVKSCVSRDAHIDETRAQIKRSRKGFHLTLRRWKLPNVQVRASDCMQPDYVLAMLNGFVQGGRGENLPDVLFE